MPCGDVHSGASGFTLIELLVTLGVLAGLSSLLIVYTRGSEGQIKILKGKAEIIGALQRARAQAVNTLQGDGLHCGYGVVVIDERSFVVWSDRAQKKCKDANQRYDGEVENAERVMQLVPGIVFQNINAPNFLRSILFVPPDPQVVTDPVVAPLGKLQIAIATSDGASASTIDINKFGAIEPNIGY